jgi:hypothetical protein
MLDALVSADLVVGRAGSSTLAEVAALGIPSVIVPYPHAGAHQGANADVLAAAGAARVVPDEAFDADALVAATDLLFDDATRTRMAAAARELGRPGAADARRCPGPRPCARRPPPRPRRSSASPGARRRDDDRLGAFDARGGRDRDPAADRRQDLRDEPLARFTTMRVGGPADLFATVHNVHELRAIVRSLVRARSR